jgi:hypothetical protein
MLEYVAFELAELAVAKEVAQPVASNKQVDRFVAHEATTPNASWPRCPIADSLGGWCLARLAAVIAPASCGETHS